MDKEIILSLDRFANAKLFRLCYTVHRYDTLFRKSVPCRYKSWLFDILKAIEEIEFFLPQGEWVFEMYKNDLKTKRAVERNLEIIGEATARILNREADFTITSSRKIISLRNRIIHGYDIVSDELIWGIIINDLPKLKSEVSAWF